MNGECNACAVGRHEDCRGGKDGCSCYESGTCPSSPDVTIGKVEGSMRLPTYSIHCNQCDAVFPAAHEIWCETMCSSMVKAALAIERYRIAHRIRVWVHAHPYSCDDVDGLLKEILEKRSST